MDTEKVKKVPVARLIFRIVAILSAVAAIVCFITPSLRKGNALSTTGNSSLNTMNTAASAISYYSADNITALAQKPQLDQNCKYIAGLLAQLCSQQGYEKMYIINRGEDKKLYYLIDGSYRDNGKAGTDYYAPATAYPTDNGYKAVKSVVDKIYSGKITGGYANELVTRADHKKAVVSCLPIYGKGHTTAAILCIEADPGNTAYHMAGQINLYYAGLIALGVFALCIAFVVLRKKLAEYREHRRMMRESGKADAVLIDDVTPIEENGEAPADEVSQSESADGPSDTAPEDNEQ